MSGPGRPPGATRPRRAALLATMAMIAIVALLVLLRLLPHPPLASYAPRSTAVYAEGGELLRLTLAADDQYRLWTPLDQVSPDYLAALQWHEDRHFRWHPGVDPLALVRALARSTGGARQGGSTITMQLARLVYHLRTRNVPGKLRQVAAAIWLECRYSKREILEAYVNLAPFGRNVQGVGAASLIYFGRPAARVSFAESLALAVIPQSPRLRGPGGPESPALRAARLRLVQEWAASHPLGAEALLAASRPLQVRGLAQLPQEAPHAVAALLQEHAGEPELHTTLVLAQQRALERALQAWIATVRHLGVANAAALLLDTRTMGVRALVGSADFHDAAIDGQVNGATARRSPGSTLKPFIYALAMDQGLIHSQSMIKDAPTAFGSYSPENFDGHFVGPVSAHDALIASRNVPAIVLSARLAQPTLYQFLQSAGVSRLASESHYGLALALGGGEVTMEELAALYGMLAQAGIYRPLHYLAGEPVQPGLRLLSPESSYIVRRILADNPRPDGLPNQQPVAAWKTGTSWGFRDAWSAGTIGPYVLVVWVGNFDGSSNNAFVGVQVAAPLFFRIADALRESMPSTADAWLRPPPGVARVPVCAASGDLPNADCPRSLPAWYIPGRSPIRVSSVHRRVPIDLRTGEVACAGTPRAYVRNELFESWPSDIQRLYAQAGMPRRRVPASHCAQPLAAAAQPPPAIVSPTADVTYQLHSSPAAEPLPLVATGGADVNTLYWFADGAFLGSSGPSVPLGWTPGHSGQFSLSVVDDQGGSASRVVRVAMRP